MSHDFLKVLDVFDKVYVLNNWVFIPVFTI
jgi:hypothetical protein